MNALTPSISALLIICLSFVVNPTLAKDSPSSVAAFCPTTNSPAFCTSAFNSDIRAPAANSLLKLNLIAIDLANDNASSTRLKIASLIQEAVRNPDEKTRLTACGREYDTALNELRNGQSYLVAERYVELRNAAFDAVLGALNCDDVYSKVANPPLAKNDGDLILLGHLILKLTDLLV